MTGNLATWSNQRGELTTDRGLFYGDGLFETIRVAAGQPIWLEAHLARLRRGCDALGISFPDNVRAEIDRGLHESQLREAVLKLIVTRTATARGYAPDPTAGSNLYVLLYSSPDASAKPFKQHSRMAVGLCSTRLSLQPRLAGHKHLNRLEQVLARSEWQHPQVAEGLMLDSEGFVIEATASNLFLVSGQTLITPRLDRCGVAGVMREWVLAVAGELGYRTEQQRVELAAVAAADGLLLTSSLLGVVAATEFVGPFAELSDPLQPHYAFHEQAGRAVAETLQQALEGDLAQRWSGSAHLQHHSTPRGHL